MTSTANGRWAQGVCLLVVALSAVVGVQARRASAEVEAATMTWSAAAARIDSVQRSPSAGDSVDVHAAGEATSLGILPGERDVLVASLRETARRYSLSAVVVSVISRPDGVFAPVRALGGEEVRPAGYAVAVEFAGRFADARQFVNSLPPSVSISRLDARRVDAGAHYQLVLSVYERHEQSRR